MSPKPPPIDAEENAKLIFGKNTRAVHRDAEGVLWWRLGKGQTWRTIYAADGDRIVPLMHKEEPWRK